jgi:competence protein ComEC
MAFGGVQWEVLAPAPGQPWRGKPQNNDSLVLRLRYGRHTFLLTGDIENGVQRRLLEQHPDLRADVLKVAHHGSRRSNLPGWLDMLQPSVAMISAGLGNSYGLPHQAVIDQLQERHAVILRTDMDGLSTVLSDGRYLQLGNMRQHSVPGATGVWLRYGGD